MEMSMTMTFNLATSTMSVARAMPIRATSLIAAGALIAAVLLAIPALAAIQLEPGEWQVTESGSEDSHAVKDEISTDCMTPEEARNPVKALSALKASAGQACKTLHVQDKGNTLSFDLECGDRSSKMSIAVSMGFTFVDARHYTGTVKSKVVFAGKAMTAEKTIVARRIGACRKH
jgi:hypothetical protein